MAAHSCRKRLSVKLKNEERGQIQILLSPGVQSVRVVKRAQALRLLAEGWRSPQVALAVGLTPRAVRNIGWRYVRGDLNRALYEAPRPGAAPRLTDSQAQQVIAMVCSDPPEGRARWTIRLIAAEAVKRKLVPRVGRETIRILLKSHDTKPWRNKKLVCRRTHAGLHRANGGRVGRLRTPAG